jgi:hypothetical protein
MFFIVLVLVLSLAVLVLAVLPYFVHARGVRSRPAKQQAANNLACLVVADPSGTQASFEYEYEYRCTEYEFER